MSKDKYAHKKPRHPLEGFVIEGQDGETVVVTVDAPDPSTIDFSATLSIARSRDGRLAVMLEVDGETKRGGPELRGKREALADLARAQTDLQRLLAGSVKP